MNNSGKLHILYIISFAAGSILVLLNVEGIVELLQSSHHLSFFNYYFATEPSYNRFLIIRILVIVCVLILFVLKQIQITRLISKLFSRYHLTLLVLSIVTYTIFVTGFFSGGNFWKEPILQDDYAVHYSDALEQVNHLRNNFRLWGYTPLFCSGMINFGMDTLWPTLFILFFQGILSTAAAFNISVLMSFLVPVVLLWFSAINFSLTKQQRSLLLLLNLSVLTGLYPIFLYYKCGCNGFIISSYFAFYLQSLTVKTIHTQTSYNHICLLLTGLFLVLLHPLGAFAYVLMFIPVIVVYRKMINRQLLLWWISGLGIIIAISVNWILSYLTQYPGKDTLVYKYLQTTPELFFTTLIKNIPFSVLLLLAGLSFYIIYRKSGDNRVQSNLAKQILLSASIICIVAFSGTQVGLGFSQPARFIIPLIVTLTLIVSISGHYHRRRSSIFRVMLILVFFIIADPRPQRFSYSSDYPDQIKKIFSHIVEHNDSRRILIQDSDLHPYCYSHLSSWAPHATDVETVAHPYTGLKPKFTQFIGDTLFGRNITGFSSDELNDYLKLYNIGWIMVYSDAARSFFGNKTGIVPVITTEIATLYKTDTYGSFAWQGTADVTADNDCIIVKNSCADTIILKYHYFKYLKVQPSDVSIDGIFLKDDPIPFIRLIKARGNCTISFR